MIFELAHHMALLPLLWLVGQRLTGCVRDPAWWWLACAFGVSWLADTAAHWVDPWLVGLVYPLSQAVLVAAVLLERDEAMLTLCAVLAIAFLATLDAAEREMVGPDVFLRTVAWGAIAGLAWQRPALGRLRAVLLVGYGLAWLAWLGYATWPGWPAWLAYQTVRAAGIALFCRAAWDPRPRLRVVLA